MLHVQPHRPQIRPHPEQILVQVRVLDHREQAQQAPPVRGRHQHLLRRRLRQRCRRRGARMLLRLGLGLLRLGLRRRCLGGRDAVAVAVAVAGERRLRPRALLLL